MRQNCHSYTYKRGKKNHYSHHPSYLYCYLFEFKYFNYLYKKNTKLLLPKQKNPLPHVKTAHSYPEISMVFFFFFNSLKYSKIFVIQILYSYHKSSSIHTNVYNFSFVQISNFFLLITILIPINKFKCPIGFQLFTVLYLIFKHYSTLPYLLL